MNSSIWGRLGFINQLYIGLGLGLNRPPGSCELCLMQFGADEKKTATNIQLVTQCVGMILLHNVSWIYDK
jgi:hypothetical protein